MQYVERGPTLSNGWFLWKFLTNSRHVSWPEPYVLVALLELNLPTISVWYTIQHSCEEKGAWKEGNLVDAWRNKILLVKKTFSFFRPLHFGLHLLSDLGKWVLAVIELTFGCQFQKLEVPRKFRELFRTQQKSTQSIVLLSFLAQNSTFFWFLKALFTLSGNVSLEINDKGSQGRYLSSLQTLNSN